MRTEWLWMDEDELRAECSALLTELFYLATMVELEVRQAYRDGYSAGVVGEPQKAQVRNAEGFVLH